MLNKKTSDKDNAKEEKESETKYMQIDKLIKKVFNRQFIWSKNVFIQVPKRKRNKMQLKKCGPSSNCLKIEKN